MRWLLCVLASIVLVSCNDGSTKEELSQENKWQTEVLKQSTTCHNHQLSGQERAKGCIAVARLEKAASLSLRNLQLKTLPHEIYTLAEHLVKLDLWGNAFSNIPDQFSQLKRIESLDMGDNRLKHIPSAVLMLPRLKILNLRRNHIAGTASLAEIEKYSALKSLIQIDLGENQLDMFPVSLCFAVSMREIYLDKNNIVSIPGKVGQLSSLEILRLDYNELVELPQTIGQLQALKELTIFKNHLSKLPDTIGDLGSLEVLFLSSNDLKMLPGTISKLQSLKKLYISGNELKKLSKAILFLENLQEIYIDAAMEIPVDVYQELQGREIKLHFS